MGFNSAFKGLNIGD